MNSKYPKMNLKYAEEEELKALSKLYLDICDMDNSEVYAFIRFYFYLINYRVENLSNKELPICSNKIWPYINHIKTALKKLVYENDDSEYRTVRKFVIDEFEKCNSSYLDKLNDEYFELKNKVARSKVLRIEYETNNEFHHLDAEYGMELNNVWMTLEVIRIRTYAVNVLKETLKEDAKEKRNFWLGIFIGAVGMLVSIVFGVIPFIK